MGKARKDWHLAKLWFDGPVFESPTNALRCMRCGFRLTDKIDHTTENLDGYICTTDDCNVGEIVYYDAIRSLKRYRARGMSMEMPDSPKLQFTTGR